MPAIVDDSLAMPYTRCPNPYFEPLWHLFNPLRCPRMTSRLMLLLGIIYIFSVVRAVCGHGFVHSVVMGGQEYPGWNPFVDL